MEKAAERSNGGGSGQSSEKKQWRRFSGKSRKSNARQMEYLMNDLHLNLGVQQLNLAHMKMHTKPGRKLVQCRPLNAGNPIFRMEFGLDDSHKAVATRVAYKMQVPPEKIKLAPHNCSCNLPGCVDPEYQFESLRDVLFKRDRRAVCDVLFYYVVGSPKTAEVAYGGYPKAKQAHAKSVIPVIHDETLAKRKACRRKKFLEMRNFPRWLNMLEILKRRGKGCPKKGQGRQANKRKITWGKVEDDVLDNPKRLKGKSVEGLLS